MVGTMPMSRPTYAPASTLAGIPSAGVAVEWGHGTKECIDFGSRPMTPAEIQKYRFEHAVPLGASAIHHGTANDFVPAGPHGRATERLPGHDVATAIRCHPQFSGAQQLLELDEAKYQRNIREPLGKAYERNFNIPDDLKTRRGFGVIQGAKALDEARQARDIVFPKANPMVDPDVDPEVHALYVRTHASWAPGEQKDRHYDWAATQVGPDPEAHAFGKKPSRVFEGVKKALNPALDPEVKHNPSIVPQHHEEFQMAAKDALGRSKVHGTVPHTLGPAHAFGKPSLTGLEPGAGQIISGFYTAEQQGPDADLGKSIRPGFRNEWHDPNRVFGIPSLRTDQPRPHLPSVANNVNYGDEASAHHLLAPARSAILGVSETHYLQMRGRAEIKRFLRVAKLDVPDHEFEDIFVMAAEHDEQPDKCCMETFMRARHMIVARALGL